VIDLLTCREISSVIDDLIPSLLYTEINGLINSENKRLNTFLLELIHDGGIMMARRNVALTSNYETLVGFASFHLCFAIRKLYK